VAVPSPLTAPSTSSQQVLPSPFRVLADVRELLLAQCKSILVGIDCTFAGPSPLLVIEGVVPPEVQLARRFGAKVCSEVVPSCTHLLVPPVLLAEGRLHCERTDHLVRQAQSHRRPLQIVDARWLLDCVSRWQRLPEADYLLPIECLTHPVNLEPAPSSAPIFSTR